MERTVDPQLPEPTGNYVHLVAARGQLTLSGTIVDDVDDLGDAILAGVRRQEGAASRVGGQLAHVRIYVDQSLLEGGVMEAVPSGAPLEELSGTVATADLGGPRVEVDGEGGTSMRTYGQIEGMPFVGGTEHDGIVHLSGQIGLDPDTGEIVDGGVTAELQQIFDNFQAVLTEAGLTLGNIGKTTVYLTSLDAFPELNAFYDECFGDTPVARTTVAVSGLALGAIVEIEAVAYRDES